MNSAVKPTTSSNWPTSRPSSRVGSPSDRPASRATEPGRDCPLCPRLAEFRQANRETFPGWHNAPVDGFGPVDARLLVVGLAPGLRGANRTGRPFTGDFAGTLLYQTLIAHGFATGPYAADPHDELRLYDCRIVNAVRCVPPKNLPLPAETRTCNPFLAAELANLPRLRVILTLGLVAHAATLRAHGLPAARVKFKHGQLTALPNQVVLANSYHVSRYNTNTGVLTEQMFAAVMSSIRDVLG